MMNQELMSKIELEDSGKNSSILGKRTWSEYSSDTDDDEEDKTTFDKKRRKYIVEMTPKKYKKYNKYKKL
jgi:hypothetical protein